ncbi:hypothetical protein EDD11_006556 [Mortierella claussenii]|nr:hypothetical protein EDD11_006556 [Mortierella claussenii]
MFTDFHPISLSPLQILQAAHLFQLRPQRTGRVASDAHQRQQQQHIEHFPLDIHSQYKDRERDDVFARLTQILIHPEFQPRLLRSSYSFRNPINATCHSSCASSTHQQHNAPPASCCSQNSLKRTRRDLLDYPIFLTGNPPDLVRLAIEFGHAPFVDHLLHRGFRPRILPEYFAQIPFLTTELQNSGECQSSRFKQASLLKRSLELNQIWECMRLANEELLDACSRADPDAVLKVLNSTLLLSRPSLDNTPCSTNGTEQQPVDPKGKGKRQHASYDDETLQIGRHPSIGYDSSSLTDDRRDQDVEYLANMATAGVGSALSQQASSSHSQYPTTTADGSITLEDLPPSDASLRPVSSGIPTIIHRSNIFGQRQRIHGDDGQTQASLSFKTYLKQDMSAINLPQHMPWVDGRALTSALLAVCFRRDGYESEGAEALEEARAVPIVTEILKYDCMLTAQSLGQAVLGVAYSRPTGSVKRAQERRRRLKRWPSRDPGLSSSGRPHSVQPEADVDSVQSSDCKGIHVSVMDLLMERIGPREWLKIIKCYLQRQEFEDLGVILELCPFKGCQLETKDKEVAALYRHRNRMEASDGWGQLKYHRQQARELICRETGVCGVGTRLSQFNGRGIGQASYNVSSTLYDSSRTLFTGGGTRFNGSYMLPRGGFRGIRGNTSGQSSLVSNNAQGGDSGESFQSSEDSLQSTPVVEKGHPFDHSDSQRRAMDGVSETLRDCQNQVESRVEQPCDQGDGEEFGQNHADYYLEFDDEPMDYQDSSLAFGGIGSSTTSSSRPGPGIVGIAIQVQAPEVIVQSLLRMGFRFFSICDLSVSDQRHPLALQFRQQERLNRQLIEFCMVPNVEQLKSVTQGIQVENNTSNKAKKRDERRYDAGDQEYHAMATDRFLYPVTVNPARELTSIVMPPSHVQDILIMGRSGGGSESSEQHQCSHQRQQQQQQGLTSVLLPVTAIMPATDQNMSQPPEQSSPALSPSSRLQFVLPPVLLGDSFESITAATAANLSTLSDSPVPGFSDGSTTFLNASNQQYYHRCKLTQSVPLPIRASMLQARNVLGSSLSGSVDRADEMSGALRATLAHQTMINETTVRRVHDFLDSQYMDLMTVGICLYQACYHKKELLLTVLLKHRLLIAQDALSGAVQVAASVGWKRGLEIMLMEHGDMEAEIDPVVITTSQHIHQSTSMRWDHATSVPLQPDTPRIWGSSNMVGSFRPLYKSRTKVSTTHRANVLLNQFHSGIARPNRSHSVDSFHSVSKVSIDQGIGVGASYWGRESRRSLELNYRATHDVAAIVASALPSEAVPILSRTIEKPIVHSARTSSLRTRWSSLFSSATANVEATTTTTTAATTRMRQASKQLHQTQQSDPPERVRSPLMLPPAVLMLSTSGLWTTPSIMMQRKSRNGVIALMAAVSRNDPPLVQWLIESLADIKVSHIMQALMIACDRGSVRVVKVLVGESKEAQDSVVRDERLLFRKWLAFQYQRITELALGVRSSNIHEGGGAHSSFNSFPFLFLMESSPLFRHYYQILNTISSSSFKKASKTSNTSGDKAAAHPGYAGTIA